MLFVSPEKLSSASFIEFLEDPESPEIAFACIDEVHCLSEWSHNFRPAYLQVQSILLDRLKISCILGLTATATKETLESITRHLQLGTGLDVIQASALRDNLILSVSTDDKR